MTQYLLNLLQICLLIEDPRCGTRKAPFLKSQSPGHHQPEKLPTDRKPQQDCGPFSPDTFVEYRSRSSGQWILAKVPGSGARQKDWGYGPRHLVHGISGGSKLSLNFWRNFVRTEAQAERTELLLPTTTTSRASPCPSSYCSPSTTTKTATAKTTTTTTITTTTTTTATTATATTTYYYHD